MKDVATIKNRAAHNYDAKMATPRDCLIVVSRSVQDFNPIRL